MKAHEVVARARKLPQISFAALKLVELLDEADSGGEAVKLIKSDGILTAKLLRVCNSSALGLAEPVSSIDQAVLLLGHRQILSMGLSLAFGSTMTCSLPSYGIQLHGLWRHAFMTATAAEALVHDSSGDGTEASVAFTAGLLHDIGKLAMAEALASGTHQIIAMHMKSEGLGRIEAEREAVGTDHAEVGACLLHIWRLPDWIVEAVARHHKPVIDPAPQLSAVIHMANRIAHLADGGPDSEAYAIRSDEKLASAFGLGGEKQEKLVEDIRKSAVRAIDLLPAQ